MIFIKNNYLSIYYVHTLLQVVYPHHIIIGNKKTLLGGYCHYHCITE